MGKIADVVKAWADKQWDKPDFEISDDANNATLKFTSADAGDFSYKAFFEVRETRDVLELILYAPITAPPAKRSAVAEAVARANFRTFGGRIDLDMDDGEIRFRAGIDVEGGQLSNEMLDNLLSIGNSILDRYLPAISAVIYAGVSPADAILQTKGDDAGNLKAPVPLSTQDAPPWEHIPGADLLQSWAQELRTACAMLDPDDTLIRIHHLADDVVADLNTIPGPAATQLQTEAPVVTAAAHSLQALSDAAIRAALASCQGNLSQAARSLGISRQTLYRKLGAQAKAG